MDIEVSSPSQMNGQPKMIGSAINVDRKISSPSLGNGTEIENTAILDVCIAVLL